MVTTTDRHEILQTLDAIVSGMQIPVTEELKQYGIFALDSERVINGKKWIGIMAANQQAYASLEDAANEIRDQCSPICKISQFEWQEQAYANGDLRPFEILQAPSGEHYAVGNAAMMGPGVYKEVK